MRSALKAVSVVAALFGALLLASCASSGTKVDPASVSSFQQGKTTYSDVIAALGPGNADSVLADGSRILVYSYVHASARPQSFIPLVGPFIAKSDATGQTYVFRFDSAGLLQSVTNTAVQTTGGAGN